MAPTDQITIRGAREHNLKNITLSIPRDKLVVFTGLSGSGKSSLAFDTIYAEGQRRYVESLSAYARQFLGQMEKPDVDVIEGLSPAISIDQKGTSKNPRSTVGTVTEVYDYLRLLYARVGHPHCPVCGREVRRQTVDQMADHVEKLPKGTRIMVLGPVVKGRKGEYRSLIDDIRKSGFVRVRVDGSLYEIGEQIPMDKNKKHDVQVVVDRIVVGPEQRSRLVESIETAARLGGGSVIIVPEHGEEIQMSQDFMCPYDGTSVPEPEPRNFSFNSPHGACPVCTGIGSQLVVDGDLVVPDPSLSLREGAIAASSRATSRSTARTARARYAPASARSSWSTVTWSCRIRRCPCAKARSRPGAARSSSTRSCSSRSASTSTSTWTSRGRSFPSRSATSS